MATDKERFTVTFEPEVLDKLEHYWRMNNFKNRNAAINALLREALFGPIQLNPDEFNVISSYKKAPPIAQEMVKSALNAGNHYANTHYSHRKASSSLASDSPDPLAHIDGDSITYTDDGSGQRITESPSTSTLESIANGADIAEETSG